MRISKHWDHLGGGVLVHYTNDSHVPDFFDPRDLRMGGHITEVVHHGFDDHPTVVALMQANAGPHEVAAAIRDAYLAAEAAAYRAANPPPPPVAAVLSHGREVRLVGGMYEVQPPRDNYWCRFATLAEAVDFGERGPQYARS